VEISTEERDGVHVLACQGALSLGAGTDAFDAAAKKLVGKGRGLVLDLSRVPYIDSTGVAAVVDHVRRAGSQAPIKVVLAASGATRRAFAITQLDSVLEIYGDVDAAIASFP
jgi:anti-sigma B factor antagonist